MIRAFHSLLLLLSISAASFAQKNKTEANFQEGFIRYSIELDGVPNEVSTFMQGGTLSFFLKEGKSKTEIAVLAGIAKMQLISKLGASENTLLMDIPTISEKKAIAMDKAQGDLLAIFSAPSHLNQRPDQFKMEVLKNKRRRIAGHSCHRVEVATSNGSPMILYVAEKIRIPKNSQLPLPWIDQLNGFPLAVELEIEGATLRLVAEAVEEQLLLNSLFDIPEDYSTQPFDEFKDDLKEKLGIGNSSPKFGL